MTDMQNFHFILYHSIICVNGFWYIFFDTKKLFTVLLETKTVAERLKFVC
jgi:hypothetical protein